MTKDNPCQHDLMGVLHCKKCGEQYHTDWLKALKEVKLDAVGEVLERIKSTIKVRAKTRQSKEDAIKLLEKSIKEVEDVYQEIITSETFLEKAKKFPN